MNIFNICLTAKVRKFNGAAQPPDALQGTNSASGSLGLMQPGGNTAELLEKQVCFVFYYLNITFFHIK